MKFSILMGVPGMLSLWEGLQKKYRDGSIGKDDKKLYKKWGNALKKLSDNPFYPSLRTHEIEPLSRRVGMKVFQSYLENRNSRALRMFWVYGPNKGQITIIALEPHPEDKKGAYERIELSNIP